MQGPMLPKLYQNIYRECQLPPASVYFSPSMRVLHNCVESSAVSFVIFGLLKAFFLHILLSLSPGLQIRF